jgi:hypothetical protein
MNIKTLAERLIHRHGSKDATIKEVKGFIAESENSIKKELSYSKEFREVESLKAFFSARRANLNLLCVIKNA